MGGDSQIPAIRRGSVKIQHGEFKNVLYVPSLGTHLLSVYQIAYTGSPKKVTFDSDSVQIIEKYTRNIIEKGNVNHASKEYEFFHFLPISHSTTLLTHSNNTRKLWHDIFGHLNLKYL